ncbi:MAG: OmpA family protein [Nevskia sp.]|nr:OmpA family protein [Nevskia sp.]
MNKISNMIRTTFAGAAAGGACLLLAACAADTFRDPGASRARAALTDLESNPKLASRAPVAIHDAETAVSEAEQPQTDQGVATHLAYIADRKVQIASAQAQARYDEDQRKALSEQNGQIQLDARTREADLAKQKNGALQAQTDSANRRNDDLQAQLEALQAKKTDRGMVLTLGDVLFSSGRSDLKPGGVASLDRLVSFLAQAPDRSVRIEGYTDDTGGQGMNQALSQKRADSVAFYLTSRGIAGNRVTSFGEGYASPVADNSTQAGRQANRRVELIIQNAVQ